MTNVLSHLKKYCKTYLTYSIILVFLVYGCSKSKITPTPVIDPPKADFSFTITTTGSGSYKVVFVNTSKDAEQTKWYFGDGAMSEVKNPEHIYTQVKTYKVKLVVTNGGGTDSVEKDVQIIQEKSTADFSFSIISNGTLPCSVKFTNSSKNADQSRWYFDDGSASDLTNPEHLYVKAKTYKVKLVVTNSKGKDSLEKDVVINLFKPTADFDFIASNGNQVPCTVEFTNKSIRGETYEWRFENRATTHTMNATRTYSSPREYMVKLIVSNATGKDSITKKVTINPMLNSLVVYLVTPKDRSFNQLYYNAVQSAVLDLQKWYKNQMGGKTFTLNPITVDTLRGNHNADWYNSNNGSFSGSDPRFYGYSNTIYDMRELIGSSFNVDKYVYLVYVAAPGGGAGSKGFCAMGDQDLKGLIHENPEDNRVGRWIGGCGHELGHSFGLPHPSNENSKAIMWTGYSTYPDCVLQADDKVILNASPFFK